jgi:CHASE2 domain-containing sensor protein
LAAHGTTDAVIGTEALAGLATAAMGEEAAGRLFGLVNLEEDADGVVRRGRLRFATRDGGFIDSWAAAAVRALVGGVPGVPPSHAGAPRLAPLGTFFIDFTAASGTDAVIAWNEWDGLLAREPSRLDGRLVVLGARLAGTGDDVLRVPPGPGGPSFMPGALIQARAVDTILSGFPVRELPGSILIVIVALGVTVMVVGLLQASTPTESLALAGAIVVVYLGFSWMAFRQGGFLVPVAAPLALLLLAAAAALALRSVHPLSDPSGGS